MLWHKEDDGNTKPEEFGSRYLNETEKKYPIGKLELLAVVWGLENFQFYLIGKKLPLYRPLSIRTTYKKKPK